MTRYPRLARRAALFLAAPLALTACMGSHRVQHRTSVVEYLYPTGRPAADTAGIATLRLPIRVGVAFVPGRSEAGSRHAATESDVPEAERLRLTKAIADHFRQRPFVKAVELIPSSYLTPGGGFQNLEQLRSMFGVDVVVLLAYDQDQFTGEDASTMTYLTLLGAYVVRGEKNSTHTMLDAVVLDVASRKLLFRAPGRSVVKGSATPVSVEKARREDRMEGFALAAADLTTNLDRELTAFPQRIRDSEGEITVQRTAEYDRRVAASGGNGAGAVDPLTLAVAAALGITSLAASRRHR